MPYINEITAFIEEFADPALAMAWDNIGLIIGDPHKKISVCVLVLDCTEDTIKFAAEHKAGLIITHHPLIFKPVNRITTEEGVTRRVISLIKNDIALFAAHTNLDAAPGGVNDALINKLGYAVSEDLVNDDITYGRAVMLNKPAALKDLAKDIAAKLNTGGVSYVGDGDRIITKLGVTGGSASGAQYLIPAVNAGCGAFLTGDTGYHAAQYAADLGLSLINAPHFATEFPALEGLAEYIKKRAAQTGLDVTVLIQDNQSDIFSYI